MISYIPDILAFSERIVLTVQLLLLAMIAEPDNKEKRFIKLTKHKTFHVRPG